MKSRMEGGFFDKPGSHAHAICPGSQWLFSFENRERKGLLEILAGSIKKSNKRAQDRQCNPEELQKRLDRSHARAEKLWKQGW